MSQDKRTAEQKLDAVERAARIVEMRRRRMSYTEIGAYENISPQRVGQIYRKALADIPVNAVEEHRAEETELIDMAINRLLVLANDGDVYPKDRVEAWNSIRGWAERKAKLLGLDAPTKHEVVTIDAVDREIARLTGELEAAELAERAEVAEAVAAEGTSSPD